MYNNSTKFINSGQEQIHKAVRWIWFNTGLIALNIPGLFSNDFRAIAVLAIALNMVMIAMWAFRIDEINGPE